MKVPSVIITTILLANFHCTVQTANGHVICTDTIVHVESNSSGIIQHVRESDSQGCTLILSGFGNGYISLPGVSIMEGSCLPTYPEVSINSQQYCVKGSLSNNEVALMTNGTLIVEVSSRTIDNFTFEYYSNVGVCGATVYTPDNRESSQLSAVLTSPPGLVDNRGSCVIIIKSDLHTNFSVLFEVLDLSVTDSISIGDKSLTTRSGKGDRLLATASNGELMLSVYAQSYYFRLKYTVLHCDSPIVITNSTYSPPAPWLPGSKVTYSCVRGYQLKDESHSTVECQLTKTSNTSVWTDHHNVQCIPEPWCHSPPPDVNHSTSVRPENYTATYNCIEGYTTNISTSERKSVCSSTNNETIPWSWSTPLFICYPVECVDNFHQLGVENSSAGTRYGVNQTYTYDCMFGYKKYQTETIRCGIDGNWSFSPNCTQMVECNMTGEINNITHGSTNSTNHRYYFMDELYYHCEDGYTRSGDVVCQSNGTWSDTPRCLLITTPTTRTTTPTTTPTITPTITPTTTPTTAVGSGNNSGQVKTTPSMLTIIIASSTGGLVGLAVVVALVAFFCIRSHRGKDSSSRTNLTHPPATMQGEENPYHVLDGPGQEYARRSEVDGAYDMVTLPSGNNYSQVSPAPQATPAANQLDISQSAARNDVYAEVQKVLGKKPFQAPVVAKTEPVYEEGPMLPLRENQVVFEENSLYDSADRARGCRGDENVIEMVDNDLYDRRY